MHQALPLPPISGPYFPGGLSAERTLPSALPIRTIGMAMQPVTVQDRWPAMPLGPDHPGWLDIPEDLRIALMLAVEEAPVGWFNMDRKPIITRVLQLMEEHRRLLVELALANEGVCALAFPQRSPRRKLSACHRRMAPGGSRPPGRAGLPGPWMGPTPLPAGALQTGSSTCI